MFRKIKKSRKRFVVIGLFLGIVCVVWMLRYNDQTQAQKNKRDWIFSVIGSRNTTALVKPQEDTVLVDGTLFTRRTIIELQTGKPRVPFVLIMVLSQIGFEKQRRVIRDTWYNWAAPLNARVVFFLGLPPNSSGTTLPQVVQEEIKQFQDIVVDNLVEDYYLLTVKVIRMLKWFVKTYPDKEFQPSFFVKTDHDVFINMKNLIRYLQSVIHIKNYVGGYVHLSAPVLRDGHSKWYTPEELWAPKYFPPYAEGPCYIMAGSVVSPVYKGSLTMPLFHLEDIFITGMVAKSLLGIPLQDVPQNKIITFQIFISFYEWHFDHAIAYHTKQNGDMQKYYSWAISQQV